MVESCEEVAFADTMIRVRPNLERVSQRYLFYIWESRATRSSIERIAKRTSGVWKVSQDDIARVELPVPSVEEQARIVDILDKFDALVNDLSSGLPAELAARRKQYEHYRDRLLTFKEAAA
jgi:type I restriction enzyme S subunit